MLGVAARHGMTFELAKATPKRHLLGTAHVLVAQKQDLVLEQQRLDFAEQAVVAGSIRQVHANQLGTDAAG